MRFKSALALFLACFFTSLQGATVFEVIRSQFALDHGLSEVAVQEQLRWLRAHPSFLSQLSESKPYIYHIITEIKKRKLPGELALIPLIESAYDPFAYSGAGAAGLWQLMPNTGSELGLKRDWWYDGRRSIQPSTAAALNYLSYLQRFFKGNWILAIAAYDCGAGTVSRAIDRVHQRIERVDFWSLPLPRETRIYLPRLLALAEIIQYPERYRVQLPNIPHVPYFAEVNIGSQIDLNHAAKLAGISYHDLLQLNPGYNRWATAPYKPFKLLIPSAKVAHFSYNLARLPENQRVYWKKHQVQAGDNLASIAKRYFTTVKLLRELNRLHSNSLKKGQYLLIPRYKTNQVLNLPLEKSLQREKIGPYKRLHIVQKGENVADIAKKYGVSLAEIKKWNPNLSLISLKEGQALTVWKL